MSRDEMAKELHGYVMTCIEGYIKKSFLSQFNGRHIMQKKKQKFDWQMSPNGKKNVTCNLLGMSRVWSG